MEKQNRIPILLKQTYSTYKQATSIIIYMTSAIPLESYHDGHTPKYQSFIFLYDYAHLGLERR
jgi:hypothetical protein